MDKYDEKYVFNAFGLTNTGAICYLNSFLQMLSSLTCFNKKVLENEEYMKKTLTGNAMYNFIKSCYDKTEISSHSTKILEALVKDLSTRRPNVQFGVGQESASEAFMHLLDMMEGDGEEKLLTDLFMHRVVNRTVCVNCEKTVSEIKERNTIFNLFYMDGQLNKVPENEEEFSDSIKVH